MVSQLVSQILRPAGLLVVVRVVGFLLIFGLIAPPAIAHHPTGGEIPANFLEGFLSGLAHPVIGLDHLAFVVATGLLGAICQQGVLIPIAFVLAALGGTGLHLMELNLPGAEFLISSSVLLFGILLAMKQAPHTWVVVGLAAVAGIVHGYAYGESIVGAEMTPLVAYLLGFTVIQIGIAIAAFRFGKTAWTRSTEPSSLTFRFAGFLLAGIGVAFLSTLILESVFPV
ncbi:MAG: HupE/UreJ family protein [Microcoleaceae cyanobacterium]